MSNARGNVVCPNCGRVFRGVGNCPNCGYGADFYERAYSAEGYSVSSGTAIPRWLLLAGTLVLLSALVYVVAPRSTGGSASCRSVTSKSSGSLVLSDAKIPDSLPQQKPSSVSCIDQVKYSIER